MFDAKLRRLIDPPLDAAGRRLAGWGLGANATTLGGFVIGIAALPLLAVGQFTAALIVILLDLVTSGGPVGSSFLPDFYRWLAPWMPAGELFGALRGVLYFDGAGVTAPIVVMAGWAVVGLVLLAAAEFMPGRSRTPAMAG